MGYLWNSLEIVSGIPTAISVGVSFRISLRDYPILPPVIPEFIRGFL